MTFIRDRLPEAISYFEGEGLVLTARGKWRSTRCEFHLGSDSMRVNTETGAWVCMSCGVKGGDVLAYRMQVAGIDFVQAAKDLGCWDETGKPSRTKPLPFSAREALSVLRFEATLVAVAACNVARGVVLSERDREALLQAASRVEFIGAEVDR